jgi:hypothetical protein
VLDWFVLLTPLALLPIGALLIFLGCAQIAGLEPPDPQSPAPVVGPSARLQLNPDPELNVIKPNGIDFKVTEIFVSWILTSVPSGVPPPKVRSDNVVRQSGDFVEPTDNPAEQLVEQIVATKYNTVTCKCDLTLRETVPVNPSSPGFQNVSVTSPPMPLQLNKNHVFELLPVWDNLKANPRAFKVIAKF